MPFDPTKPFEVVGSSGFDPTKPFEIVTDAKPSSSLGQKAMDFGGDLAAEAGGATAGQMIGGIFAVPTFGASIAVGGAIGGGIGNTIAQMRRMARGEQEDFSWGQLAGTAGVSAIPGGSMVKAAKGIGARAVAGNVGKAAAEGVALTTAQKAVQVAIDEQRIPTWDDLRLSAAGGLAFGAGIGTLGVFGKRIATALQDKPPAQAKAIIEQAMEGRTGDELDTLKNLSAKVDEMMGIGAPTKPATEVAPVLTGTPQTKSAKASATAMLADEADAARRQRDLIAARAEEAVGDVKANQVAGPENIALGDNPIKNQLTAIETRPGASAKERARVEAKLAEQAPKTPDDSIRAKLSPQASRMMDQYGGVDPRVIKTIAWAGTRKGTGFAIGYQVGDTEEEKLGNGFLWASAGLVASPAMAQKLGRKIAEADVVKNGIANVLPAVTLKELRHPLYNSDNNRSFFERDGAWAVKRMKETMDKFPALSEDVSAVIMGGKPVDILPPAVRPVVAEVRYRMDELQKLGVEMGIFRGPLAEKIAQQVKESAVGSIGKYVHRAYRIHSEPDYVPDQKHVDGFITHFVKQFKDEHPQTQLTDDAIRVEAQDAMVRLLTKNKNDFALSPSERFSLGGGIIGKSGSVMTPRKNLDEATRNLLGEIKDPVRMAGETVTQLSRLIANHDMQKQLREIGLRTGLFKKHGVLGDVALAETNSKAFDVLSDLYTTPAVATALGKITKLDDWGAAWKLWSSMVSYAKISKTVTSLESQAPNVIGAMLVPAQQGHVSLMLDPDSWRAAKGIVSEEIGLHQVGKHLEQDFKFLLKHGELNQSISARDIDMSLKESLIQVPGAVGLRKLLKGAMKIYGAPDTFGRVLNFFGEKARYKRAFPDMPEEQLNLYALDINRKVSPHHDEVPEVLKVLSKAGVSNQFISYIYEISRNTYNGAKIGLRDIEQGMKTGNQALSEEGAKRFFANTAFLAAGSAWGLSALSKREQGITDEREKAMRSLVPDYDRNGIWHFGEASKEKFSYSNQSYFFPVSIPGEMLTSAISGETPWQAALRFAEAVGRLYLGDGGLILRPAMEAIMNRNEWDAKIVKGEATTAQHIAGRGGHFLERAFLPLFLPQLNKFLKAAKGEEGKDGQVYTLEDRFDRLLGKRVNTVNVPKRLERKAIEFSKRLSEESSLWNSDRRNAKNDQELETNYARHEQGRQRIFGEVQEYMKHAEALGYNQDETIKLLRDGGMSSNFILGAVTGDYIPATRSKDLTPSEVYESMRTTPLSQQVAELNRIALSDPALARGVRDRMRSGERAKARGWTAVDELIDRLDETSGERARFFQKQMDKIPDRNAKMAYLQTMAQKGHVPPSVRQQLTEYFIFR